MARARRQTDRPTRAQVWLHVGRADVALTAVADNTAVRRDFSAKSSGLVSKVVRLWELWFLPGLPGGAHGIAHTPCGRGLSLSPQPVQPRTRGSTHARLALQHSLVGPQPAADT